MKVTFKNKKGLKLVGLLDIPKEENPPVIVLMHGLKGNKNDSEFFVELAKELPKKGFAVLRFDFNSHGESDSDWENFTRAGCTEDFKAAIEFLKTQKVDLNRLGIFATSMGAVPFIIHPTKVGVAVLHDPFILSKAWHAWFDGYEEEIRERGYIKLKAVKTGKIVKFGVSLLEESKNISLNSKIKDTKCPTLFIFSKNNYERFGKKTYELFKCKKDLKIIDGLGHVNSTPQARKELAKLAIDWFKKHL